MGSKTSLQGNVFSSSMDSNAPPSAYFDGDSSSGASSDEDRPLNMNTPSGVLPDYKPPRDSVPFHTHDIRPLPPYYDPPKYSLTYECLRTHDPADWVRVLAGCPDEQLLVPATRAQVFQQRGAVAMPGVPEKQPHLVVRNLETGREFDAGTMALVSVRALREAVDRRGPASPSSVLTHPPLIFDMPGDSVCFSLSLSCFSQLLFSQLHGCFF